ncbi:hypothetical protein NL676_004932 [Syzygium grande]|nr:hypothetical protein NL676_004932 [Syzygium grande]
MTWRGTEAGEVMAVGRFEVGFGRILYIEIGEERDVEDDDEDDDLVPAQKSRRSFFTCPYCIPNSTLSGGACVDDPFSRDTRARDVGSGTH